MQEEGNVFLSILEEVEKEKFFFPLKLWYKHITRLMSANYKPNSSNIDIPPETSFKIKNWFTNQCFFNSKPFFLRLNLCLADRS